jgi:hypothetical protein
LLSIAKDQTHGSQNWREHHKRFDAPITQYIDTARDFFWVGTQPDDPFPLDCQWI